MRRAEQPTEQPTERRAVAAFALLALPDMGPKRLSRLLERWPDPEEVAEAVLAGRAGAALEETRGIVGLARTWRRALDLERARALLASRPTRVLVLGDAGHPIEPELPDAPPVLLVEGDRDDVWQRPRVAIVGTRAATPHGLHDAVELGHAMAEAGVTVVSGLAVGIDGAAHRGVLDAGGLAVGVLGTGLDVVYPLRHDLLFERVRASGALVSELIHGTPPRAHHFPVRNRIIAALADVVVVVEATERGGARITAEHALDYGRPVLAVPGSRRNASAAGCNRLLAEGAQPLLEPSDVLVALGLTPGARRLWEPRSTRDERHDPGADARSVEAAFGGEPATPDQLSSRTGLSPAAVSVAVVALERAGRATRSRGMVWPL